MVILSLNTLLGTFFYGIKLLKRYLISDVVQIVVRIGLTILLIYLGLSYFGVVLSFFIGYILGSFFLFRKKYFRKYNYKFNYKQLFSYALPALIIIFSEKFYTDGLYILLAMIQNTEATGLFTIALTITSTLFMIINIQISAAFPIISSLSTYKKGKDKQGYVIGMIIRYSLFIVVPLAILAILFSKYAILLFSKPEYLPSADLFPYLVPGSILFGLGGIFLNFLYAIGKPNLQRNLTIIFTIIVLVLSVTLTYYFSILGLSIAYFIAMLIRFLLGLKFITKHLKINFFLEDIAKIFLASTIISVIFIILKPFIKNIQTLIIVSIPVVIIYLFLLKFFRFYKKVDIKILEHFRRRIKKSEKIIIFVEKIISN
jgi:O-antigen/teichoic acid export membrane protein